MLAILTRNVVITYTATYICMHAYLELLPYAKGIVLIVLLLQVVVIFTFPRLNLLSYQLVNRLDIWQLDKLFAEIFPESYCHNCFQTTSSLA
jgi:hypothetical protein